ncbi:MAG: VCBS repeat-containing protein, partial [Deltaproteobacteria bacterium]|nr:VCBS repeat-containing protein [Deltaproteobacteria bacterium]
EGVADDGVGDGAGDACPPAMVCGTACCVAGELCFDGRCVRDGGPCADDDACGDDAWCEPTLGRCLPYDDVHDRNEECRSTLRPGDFRTRVQCEFAAPPAEDAYPSHVNASSLPLVVDFRRDAGPDDPPRPSLVVVMGPTDGGTAILRVLDGTTCELLGNLAEHTVIQGTAPAAGDLDGDGRPEVVAPLEAGGVAAWSWDETAGEFRVLWRSTDTTASGHSYATTLADLDDDGTPEILVGALVYGADGTLLSAAAGQGDGYCGSGRGYVAPGIAVDVDLDGRLELVQGTGVWEWSAAAGDLVRESYWTGAGLEGPAAVADFGDWPSAAGDAPGRPEIAVIGSGHGALVSVGGDVVFGPVAFPGVGDGGNPTVADFDGDGRPEFATAGLSSYTVFDPDCLAGAARGGACGSGRIDGILWTRPIQENSCAIMGSTVFDFEGDGAAEAVYADECFARVFDGRDGRVVWSRARSSATWIEGPTLADTDADYHAEMVMTATDSYRPSCPATDPIDPGMGCTDDAECPGAAPHCAGGLCRCSVADDCGDAELTCAAPLDGSDALGNVCRASFRYSHGVRIYADVRDRWAGSRMIWNQHAYDVTNVNDDGTIPRGSAVRRNWEVAGLNNFRQNVQGDLERAAAADLTVAGADFGRDCTEDDPELPLVARVCNRGLLGAAAGAVVVFYDGDPASGGTEVCRTTTTRALGTAECEEVGCTWSGPPIAVPLDVWVAVDPDAAFAECLDGNNFGTLEASCPPLIG